MSDFPRSMVPSTPKVVPRPTFGPYIMLEAAPWLLLATVMRARAKMLGDGALLLVMLASEFVLFLAFLIATQKMVERAGGITSLGRLAMADQLRLAGSAVWRLMLLFFCTVFASLVLGMNKQLAAGAWVGFDAIVYFWPLGWHPVWPALIATLVFLFVIERGMECKPTAKAAVGQMLRRWRHFIPAAAFIALFLALMNRIQPLAGDMVQLIADRMSPGPMRNLLYIGFLFFFSYVRLLVTITVLTFAARASWRNDPAMSR